jgi:hypothetical protein
MDPRAHRVPLVLVQLEPQVLQVVLEQQELQEQVVLKDTKVLLDPQVLQVQVAHKAIQAQLVP